MSGRLHLAAPPERASPQWQEALAALLGWLGIGAEEAPGQRGGRLALRGGPAADAPVFAPWTGWCPTAFQNGGQPGMPEAQFLAGYLVEHPRAAADPRRGGTDIMLLSPHPAACEREAGGIPRAGVFRAMIRAALAEGRRTIAILVPTRHRAGVAAMRLGDDPRLCPPGVSLALRAFEEAIPALLNPASGWEAIVAMPDQRAAVLALLAEATKVRGPLPLLWYDRARLLRVTAEAPGKGKQRLPLDAAVLVHALSLALREAGLGTAARRLHASWARLRASGVTTPGRGGDAPYLTEVAEAEFLALLCQDEPCDVRGSLIWQAVEKKHLSVSGNPPPALRIVPSNLARP